MTDTIESIVCDECMMRIPSEIHAKAHTITLGHETRLATLTVVPR
jgi:hypothetical protein